jgi:hypothetical protein
MRHPASLYIQHPAIASSCIRFRRGHISFLIPSSKDQRRRRQVAPFFLISLQQIVWPSILPDPHQHTKTW